MIGKKNQRTSAIAACVVMGSLGACSDSDLEEYHAQQFDAAIAEYETAQLGAAIAVEIDLDDYALAFQDDFNGATIDDSKWSTSLWAPGTVLYDQQQYFVDSQNPDETFASPFNIENGVLSITATRTPESELSSAYDQPWLSGLLTTREDFNFTQGYVEARISVSAGVGMWPSLWMLGSELDGLQPQVFIMEHNGSDPNALSHNYNFTDSEGEVLSPGQQSVQLPGLTSGFNTVGLRWNDTELLFFVNGQPTYKVIGDSVPNEDMYLILNLAMGGVWTGDTDTTTPDPAEFKVDYVRVYQLQD